MTLSQRRASTVFGLLAWVAFIPLFVGFGDIAGLVLIIIAITGGARLIPGFWRTLGGSIAAGAIAGILVLGPGLRLAMRIVAITDPVRSTEFTVEGTFFIIVFLGAILGSMLGISTISVRNGLGLGRWTVSIMSAIAVLGIILASADLRSEILHLGLGPWMNVPMFGLVGYLHGLALQKVFDHLKFARIQPAPPVEVMA